MPIPQDERDRDAAEEAWASDFGDAREPPQSANGQSHATPNESASSLPLVFYRDIRPALDAADFVEGLLIDGAMSVIYGESGCGKTFFTLDLALHVAAGLPWRGREVEKGGVLYLSLEGSHGISNRVAAFKVANGADDADLPLAVVPVSVNLLDAAGDVVRVIDAAETAAATLGMAVRLVVIDTLSRALAGGNENDPKDMGALVRNIDYIRQQLLAHVATVHHSGKDSAKGARGHSLLRAATDTEIEVTRNPLGKISTAKVTKQRDLDCDGQFAFSLDSIPLGTNRRGKPVTSCVVRPIDAEDLSAQAEAAATEKAAEIAERKAAEAAEKARVKDETAATAAAARLTGAAEKTMAAIDEINKKLPAATKKQIRGKTNLSHALLGEALCRLMDAGTIEPFEFEKATGTGGCTVKTLDGYRRPTPVMPGATPGFEPYPGVTPGMGRVQGDAGGGNAGGESLPLGDSPACPPVVNTPSDSAEDTGASNVSNPSEGKTKRVPETSTDKPAPRKPNHRRAAEAKPKLFVEPAAMPD